MSDEHAAPPEGAHNVRSNVSVLHYMGQIAQSVPQLLQLATRAVQAAERRVLLLSPVWSSDDVSAVFGVSRDSLNHLIGEGMPFIQAGRRRFFHRDSVCRWMEGRDSRSANGRTTRTGSRR